MPQGFALSSFRARVVELALVAFVGLIASAMALYPGGTWYEPARKGHAFWENFLCDLLHRTSISGEPNEPGWLLATLGMISLVPGLVAFVLLVPEVVSIEHAFLRALRRVAIGACVLLATIPLLPTDRFGTLHAAAVVGAGVPATLSLSVLITQVVIDRRFSAWMRLLSVLVLCGVGLSLALYVHETFFGGDVTRALPVLARVSTILLLVWLAAFAQLSRRVARPREAVVLSEQRA